MEFRAVPGVSCIDTADNALNDAGTRHSETADATDGHVGQGQILVDDTENEPLRRTGSGRRTNDDKAAVLQFNAMVLSCRLRKVVRGLTNRDGGGVLQPDEDGRPN